MITRYTFQEVKRMGDKNLPCPGCGNKVKRRTTIVHTINPYNRRTDGTPKSYTEVLEDVYTELKTWQKTPVVCTKCKATP
jgi:hypothetical protein